MFETKEVKVHVMKKIASDNKNCTIPIFDFELQKKQVEPNNSPTMALW